jgi:hypothetical protein
MNLGFLEKYLLCHGEVFRRDSWPRIWSAEFMLLDLHGDCPRLTNMLPEHGAV